MEHLHKLKKITLATIKKLFLYKVEPSSYCNFIGTCQKLLEGSAQIRLLDFGKAFMLSPYDNIYMYGTHGPNMNALPGLAPNDIPGREGLRTGLLCFEATWRFS